MSHSSKKTTTGKYKLEVEQKLLGLPGQQVSFNLHRILSSVFSQYLRTINKSVQSTLYLKADPVRPIESRPSFGGFLRFDMKELTINEHNELLSRKETENLLPTAQHNSGQKLPFFSQKSAEKIKNKKIIYEYKIKQVIT